MASRYKFGYVRVFKENNPPPPWTCSYCDELIYELGKGADKGSIHHKDEDKHNNDPDNLEVLHGRCHASHHGTGKNHTDSTRAKMRQSAIGHSVSAETRQKISDANRGNKYCVGRQYSPETREKLRKMGNPVTCECGMTTYPGSMKSHTKSTGHKVVPS